ncbi:hypothetical protein ABEQ78_17315 [Bacillus altitudinis]|uniref:Uncharacterized protein n=1 Tax=Bacillus altitudinis TaxID=293387 RepID=A0A653VEU4_BACAB|nr:hypothetical protein [Bacillus altitudinis]MDM5164177.1 hypothetical protein [Bacillus altitudinis]MDX2364825.1 hypothetical protein [Bacillus altitudinis]MED0850973.1 hypothetical protein [Bacillus altitudinis]VXC03971.1 conserved hypothetical protein [Bacillus altitudinis]
MRGWIKLHRKLRENPVFNNPSLLRLWLICLTEASHKHHQQMIGNQVVELEPGQFVTGRYDIAEMFNKGLRKSDQVTGKVTVYRWLEKLEEMNFLSIKKSNKFSVVTINKWALYQQEINEVDHQNDHQMNIKRSSNEHQMITNKNVKNVKNVYEEEEERSPVGNDSPFQQIEDKYLSRRGGGLMITPNDAQAIERIIQEQIPLEDILVWIDEIFDQYRPRHRADGIKSFSYLEKGILDRWHAKNQPSNISEFKPKKQQDNLSALAQYAKEKGIKFGGG